MGSVYDDFSSVPFPLLAFLSCRNCCTSVENPGVIRPILGFSLNRIDPFLLRSGSQISRDSRLLGSWSRVERFVAILGTKPQHCGVLGLTVSPFFQSSHRHWYVDLHLIILAAEMTAFLCPARRKYLDPLSDVNNSWGTSWSTLIYLKFCMPSRNRMNKNSQD